MMDTGLLPASHQERGCLMDLYSRPISPYAARVRVSIKAKGLDVRILDNPDVLSADFGEINPMRKVPVLVLADGRALPESEAIVEYLEDAFPNIPLRPADSFECARARLIARTAELYVFPAVVDIFKVMGSGAGQIETFVGALDARLGELSALMKNSGAIWHAAGKTLSIADGALAPFLFYVDIVGRRLNRNLLAGHPPLQHFMENCRSEPALTAVIGEIGAAMGLPQS
jgi:glutathione S-transferase